MTDHIENAVEARRVVSDLLTQLKGLPYNADLYKYLKNIDGMIGEFSSLEVEARRTRKNYKVIEYRVKLLQSIKHLEQMILMLRLMN